MRPIIGMLAEVDSEFVTRVQGAYVSAIETAGGVPVLFPYVEKNETVERFVSLCDGFFFTGGADIDPKYYGEAVKESCGTIQPHRDELEFSVLRRAVDSGKPILAICRGAQLVNVALGGTLYQDIPSEIATQIAHRQLEEKTSPSHGVRILAETPLHTLMGTEQMKANSFHHQAIKTLGKGLAVMATAEDGLVEGVYGTGGQYLRAYQWHPERLCGTDKQNHMIFEDFINACKSNHF